MYTKGLYLPEAWK